MPIHTKLTLLYTAITAVLLTAFSVAIYWTYTENREEEFFRLLRLQATIKANLLLDAQVEPEVLQLIYQQSRTATFQEEVAIYDTSYNLLYHDAVEIDFVKETPEMLDEIRDAGELRFWQENWQVLGFRFEYENNVYLITAAAYDHYGFTKAEHLRYSMFIGLLIAIVVCFFLGRIYSRKSLEPVSEMVDKVEDITATNLDLRVNEGNGKDEIAELAITFNNMLDRLENSFESQKHFVSNISHEVRTPLSTIIAELDLALSKPRSAEEYEKTISLVKNDAVKISRLITGLLDLAKADYDKSAVKFRPTRVDEVLLDARKELMKADSAYSADINFEIEESDQDVEFSILGNEYLLKVAFLNLMENACKYAPDNHCKVSIRAGKKAIMVYFKDNGPGIPKEEQSKVFEPFYRGKNQSLGKGNGIGLALTQKIVSLHRGSVTLTSAVNRGTEVGTTLPL
ncbi:ATP-binding protein [Cytophagaceae bacterium ABcell3]|nr:ATP-binding protein [Cytophagaceae bacterium ABcell3]